jgi:hypothetical protein
MTKKRVLRKIFEPKEEYMSAEDNSIMMSMVIRTFH